MSESTAIAKRLDMGALIQQAVEHGSGVDTLERLLAMAKDVRAEQSRAAWHQAMAAFQAEAPDVIKNKTANVATRTGGSYSYSYASLDSIISVVRPVLARHGLSVVFQTEVKDGQVTARCVVAHSDGHTETCEFAVPMAATGRMNAAQEIGSAATYARRYAYCAALGLAPEDDDDGANAADAPAEPTSARWPGNTGHPGNQTRAAKPEAGPPVWSGKLVKREEKTGKKKNGEPWTLYTFTGADGQKFGTFSKTIADGLLALDGHFIEIVSEQTAQGNANIVEYRDANADEVPV